MWASDGVLERGTIYMSLSFLYHTLLHLLLHPFCLHPILHLPACDIKHGRSSLDCGSPLLSLCRPESFLSHIMPLFLLASAPLFKKLVAYGIININSHTSYLIMQSFLHCLPALTQAGPLNRNVTDQLEFLAGDASCEWSSPLMGSVPYLPV